MNSCKSVWQQFWCITHYPSHLKVVYLSYLVHKIWELFFVTLHLQRKEPNPIYFVWKGEKPVKEVEREKELSPFHLSMSDRPIHFTVCMVTTIFLLNQASVKIKLNVGTAARKHSGMIFGGSFSFQLYFTKLSLHYHYHRFVIENFESILLALIWKDFLSLLVFWWFLLYLPIFFNLFLVQKIHSQSQRQLDEWVSKEKWKETAKDRCIFRRRRPSVKLVQYGFRGFFSIKWQSLNKHYKQSTRWLWRWWKWLLWRILLTFIITCAHVLWMSASFLVSCYFLFIFFWWFGFCKDFFYCLVLS